MRDGEGVWEGGSDGMCVCAPRQRRDGWVCAREAERERERWRQRRSGYVCVQGRVRVKECGRGAAPRWVYVCVRGGGRQGRACVCWREREGDSDEGVCEGKVE